MRSHARHGQPACLGAIVGPLPSGPPTLKGNVVSRTLAEHFIANDGLATSSELAAFGLSPSTIQTRSRNGLLVRKGPQLYALAGHPETARQRIRAALLRVDTGSASHRTSAHLLGLDTFGSLGGRVELVVLGSRNLKVDGVTIHRTNRLDDCDITEVDGLRCTSAARTIIDLAAMCSEKALLHAIGSAVRDGRTSVDYLRGRLSDLRTSGRRGVVALDDLLATMPGGSLHSTLEISFLEISRSVIDLIPETQVRMAADGAMYRLDAAYPGCPLVVEVDGHGAHSTSPQRTADARRDRDLAANGKTVLRFTSHEVFREPARVAQDLRRALVPWFGALVRRPA